jgi:peptidoglycan hydrolase CwlO-like protein
MSENKKNQICQIIFVIILIILLILLFPLIIVKENSDKVIKKKEELSKLKKELKKTEEIITRTQSTIDRLEKTFKISFGLVRLIVISSIAAWNLYLLHSYGLFNGISIVVDVNSFILIIIIGTNFLLFGNITNIEQLTKRLEVIIKNFIYRHNKDIHYRLLFYDETKKKIVNQVERIKMEIEELEKNINNSK